MTEQNLKDKTVIGTFWSAADNIANQGITFLVGLLLARMLTPEEYGLIGIITIFISIFNSIVDSGFSNALIRKKDADDVDYNTVFWSNMLISGILFILLFLSSNVIASFFNSSQLKPLTEVMSIIIIINAFAIIQRTILIKKIDFKTQTKVSLISSVFSGIIGFAMAFMGMGVWALVGQQLSRQLANSSLLWLFNTWRPHIIFSWSRFNNLFNFGWKLLVSGLIDTLWQQFFQVVIGKYYTPSALGQYTRANDFSKIFSSNITSIVHKVSFPVLSFIQDDKQRMRLAYRRVIKITVLITFSCMLGLAGCAENFVYVLVGEQWLPCVPMLQIICFMMMLYPLQALNLNLLQVAGRSDLFLKLEIIKKIIAIVPLLLGIYVGIYWMLISSVFVSIISYFLNAYYSGTFINYGIYSQIKDIIPSLVLSFLIGCMLYFIGMIDANKYFTFLLQLFVGGTLFIFLCEIFKLEEFVEIKDIIRNIIAKR